MAIVFSGWRALGAYEYGVIKALYEDRRRFKPAAVTGISIGAIKAAIPVGAKDNPLETLERLWRKRFTELLQPPVRTLLGPLITRQIEQGLAAFGHAGMYQLRQEYLLAPPHIPPQFRREPAYQSLFAKHKKIDAPTVITAKFPDDKANAGDFSEDTIAYRIKAGYENAKKQNIRTPHPL